MRTATDEKPLIVKRLAGYLVALACLAWVFHDVHPRQVLSAMRVGNWWFVIVSMFFDVLTYVLQGMRWKLLLSPVGRIKTIRASQAIYAGLFTNEILPLRFGELVRAYLASRWIQSRISSIIPSMVIERFIDALWLAVGIGIAAIFVPLPKNLLWAGDMLGVLVLLSTVAFIWLVAQRERELEHEPEQPDLEGRNAASGRIRSFVSQLAAGLRDIGSSRNLYGAILASAGMLGCQALAVWYVMLACDIKLSFAAAIAVTLIVRLGTAIPNAPANVGSFQFFTVLALGLFGISKTIAAAFSIVDFAVLTLPLWSFGLFSISRTGMTLGQIRGEIAALRR